MGNIITYVTVWYIYECICMIIIYNHNVYWTGEIDVDIKSEKLDTYIDNYNCPSR